MKKQKTSERNKFKNESTNKTTVHAVVFDVLHHSNCVYI